MSNSIVDNNKGCFNQSADSVKRVDTVWSDGNLNQVFTDKDEFTMLKCRNCGGLSFEVLQTTDYTTSAKCDKCNMYYDVHCG